MQPTPCPKKKKPDILTCIACISNSEKNPHLKPGELCARLREKIKQEAGRTGSEN